MKNCTFFFSKNRVIDTNCLKITMIYANRISETCRDQCSREIDI